VIRQILEKLSRGVVLKRKLPRDLGGHTLFVSPASGGLKYWKLNLSSIDPDLLNALREAVHPGSTFWDIGANVGLVSYASAYLAGPSGFVLAIEPDLDSLMLLHQSSRRLDLQVNARVEFLQLAVSSPGARFAEFAIAMGARATNSIKGYGRSKGDEVQEVRSVPVVTLDELLQHFRTPHVVKIDVEGAEVDVLRGATELLSKARPTLLVEVWSENAEEASRILRSHSYRLYDASVLPPSRKELELTPWDTLAIPDP
jgi:FkbM family methyltransferase